MGRRQEVIKEGSSIKAVRPAVIIMAMPKSCVDAGGGTGAGVRGREEGREEGAWEGGRK